MKRLLIWGLAALTAISSIEARQLDSSEALQNALAKMQGNTQNNVLAAAGVRNNFKLIHTAQDGDATPIYYVYQTGEGFLMAGADSRSEALLGYTDQGDFETSKSNPAFMSWLQSCTEALQWLNKQPEFPVVKSVEATTQNRTVAPLLGGIKWNQRAPFNNLCPKKTSGGSTSIPPTGCVATAMAQIMMYHKWPASGTGRHINKNEPTQSVDFKQSTYQWDIMKETYSEDDISESADAVSKLLYDLGCAFDMQYNANGSGAYDMDAYMAMANYFKYDNSIKLEERKYFTTADWNSMLHDELDNGRPVYFSAGTSAGSGHAFVLDGYDANGLYHVNWGWGGTSNGYFNVNYLDPSVQGTGGSTGCYNIEQTAITHIQKKSTDTSMATSSITMDGSMQYVKSTFSFIIYNMGLNDFTGEVGFILYDKNGKQLDKSSYNMKTSPISSFRGIETSYKIPSNITVQEGYRVVAFYSETYGGEVKPIRHELTEFDYLVAFMSNGELTWGVYQNDLPKLEIKDFQVVTHYKDYAPKFSLTITNTNLQGVEFNNNLTAWVYSADDKIYYCFGQTQCFLAPGESKTLILKCVNEYEGKSYSDLAANTKYNYSILYYSGISQYELVNGTFTIESPKPSDVTYSNFGIDKTILTQGEILTATFDAVNSGGYTNQNYYFYIFLASGGYSVAYLSASDCDIMSLKTSKVTMSGPITLNPGNYMGLFYDGSGWMNNSQRYRFTVREATTSIEAIQQEEDEADVIYDLQGRRVTQMQRGKIYLHNGKKILKHEE